MRSLGCPHVCTCVCVFSLFVQCERSFRPWHTNDRGSRHKRIWSVDVLEHLSCSHVTAALVNVAHHFGMFSPDTTGMGEIAETPTASALMPLNSSDSYRALRLFDESVCSVPGVMAHLHRWTRSLVDGACHDVVSYMTQSHVTWLVRQQMNSSAAFAIARHGHLCG